MKTLRISIIILVLLSLIAGCAGMSPREQRVLSGGAIGAGAGAAVGAVTGHSVAGGAAIGAAAGAVGGLVVDESKKRKHK
jgi:osmotically inducible lipoprotein OsmB